MCVYALSMFIDNAFFKKKKKAQETLFCCTIFVTFIFLLYCVRTNFRTRNLATKNLKIFPQHQLPSVLHWYFCNLCLFYVKITLLPYSRSATCIYTDVELLNLYDNLLKLRYFLICWYLWITDLEIYIEIICEIKISSENSISLNQILCCM